MKKITFLIAFVGVLALSSCARKAPCPAYTDAIDQTEQPASLRV
jgi:PBP1b-binding outer membrane lipoprotein LpoB